MKSSSDIVPIDFRKLLREEKKRVRENQRTKLPQPNDATTNRAAASAATTNLPALPLWESCTHRHCWNVPLLNRHDHCVCNNPASIFYLPSFVPPQLGRDIWDWLQKLPLATTDDASDTTINKSSSSLSLMAEPAAACWHVLRHAKRKVALFECVNGGLPFPPPLQVLVDALIQAGVFPGKETENDDDDGPPNHILVNEYTSEQGILPHTDGPAYYSRTATISLGQGNVLLNFEPRPDHHQQQQHTESSSLKTLSSCPQLLLHGGGSLVVFENAAYLDYMHSIAQQGEERASHDCLNASQGTPIQRQPRISLTIRRKRHRRE